MEWSYKFDISSLKPSTLKQKFQFESSSNFGFFESLKRLFLLKSEFRIRFGIKVTNIITLVFSRDGQDGENGRVSYHFKVSNQNVDQTNEFIIDTTTGEIRAKTKFDREMKDRYELVLVARDHGKPVSFETLRFVSIVIKDVNDHEPMFKTNEEIRFTVISRIFFLKIC